MLFWGEMGRRIKAEEKLAESERVLAALQREQAEAERELAAMQRELATVQQELAAREYVAITLERDAANARIRELEAKLARRNPPRMPRKPACAAMERSS